MLTPTGKLVLVLFRVRVVRACVRACEAVWACEGMCLSTLGARLATCLPSGLDFAAAAFIAIRKGFKENALNLLLYVRVLRTDR